MSTRPAPTQEEFFGTEDEPLVGMDITDEVGDFVAAVKAEVRSYYARRCARHALVAFLAGAATGAVAALAAVMAVARG